MKIKKKPKFRRQSAHRRLRLRGKGWRYPRGCDSKQMYESRYMPRVPKIGYSTGRKEEEILIHNVNELSKVGKNKKVKIASAVGKKKRRMILDRANELKITIKNA